MHRIESRNAFVACVNNHATGDLVVFLICEHCGAVGEAASAAVADQLKAAARAAGFTPKAPVIEIGGVCAHCRQAAYVNRNDCPSASGARVFCSSCTSCRTTGLLPPPLAGEGGEGA